MGIGTMLYNFRGGFYPCYITLYEAEKVIIMPFLLNIIYGHPLTSGPEHGK